MLKKKGNQKLTLKEQLINKLRLVFVKRKTYMGSYADNLKNMKKFYQDNKIIVGYIEDEALKMTFVKPQGEDALNPGKMQAAYDEQKRQFNREMRKTHKSNLYYVEDHFLTRAMGWKPTQVDMALAR